MTLPSRPRTSFPEIMPDKRNQVGSSMAVDLRPSPKFASIHGRISVLQGDVAVAFRIGSPARMAATQLPL